MSASLRHRKQDLRDRIKAEILALSAERRADMDRAVHARFLESAAFRNSHALLLYFGHFAEEIPTVPLVDATLSAGKVLVLPRVRSGRGDMSLHRIADPTTDLAPGCWRIPEPRAETPRVEPKAVDLVLVPGLAFDPDGYRLGRGGGFYDRLLADAALRADACSIAYDVQVVPAVPREPHDRPVGLIFTESRTIDVSGHQFPP